MLVFKELIDCLIDCLTRGNIVTNENSYRKYFLPRHKIKKNTTSKLLQEIFMINQLMT